MSSSTSGGADASCISDASPSPGLSVGSPTTGTIIGSDVDVVVCAGSANAYLERPVSGGEPYLMLVNAGIWGGVEVNAPADTVGSLLTATIGVSGMGPGTYGSATGAVGTIILSVYPPIPQGLDCGDGGMCPPGCAFQGPISGPSCQPIQPETDYIANAPEDILGGPQAPAGSWSLEITSAAVPLDDASYDQRFLVHGTLTATLVEMGSGMDGGCPTTAALSLSF